MFKMIFSELKYFKSLFIFAYGLILALFIGALFFEDFDVYELMIISSITFFIMVIIVGVSSDGEKRERLYALLPLSAKTLGKQRLLFTVLYQTSFFLLWMILYVTRYVQTDQGVFWTMISTVMFNLIIVCLFMIYGDLGFYEIRLHKPILAFVIACSLILYSTKISHFESDASFQFEIGTIQFEIGTTLEAYKGFFELPFGALFMSLLAGIIHYISYRIYINRRSYLA